MNSATKATMVLIGILLFSVGIAFIICVTPPFIFLPAIWIFVLLVCWLGIYRAFKETEK
jgi:hypothetical protein